MLLISSMANDTVVDHTLRGHRATLAFSRTGFTITPQALYRDELKEIVHKKTGGEDMSLHHRNWYAAIRTGEALKCDATLGMYGVIACQMGVLSLRSRKYMRWDGAGNRAIAV